MAVRVRAITATAAIDAEIHHMILSPPVKLFITCSSPWLSVNGWFEPSKTGVMTESTGGALDLRQGPAHLWQITCQLTGW